MSRVVKLRLQLLNLLPLTDHEDRQEIDREIERRTKLNCDQGVEQLTDEQFKELVYEVLKRKKKKVMEAIA